MAEIFDYKKEYRDLYLPKTQPSIIDVPEMIFVAVEGKGDPNDPDGEYQEALGLLYGIQYTIKMSKKGNDTPEGYIDYVVPPLEGLWWSGGAVKNPPADKSKYNWLSMIRLPEYVTKKVFEWACREVSAKKKLDTAKAKYIKIKEGLCVQCMHTGSFDDEPATIAAMESYAAENGYAIDIGETRRHHEIYLSDPRKVSPEKMKTVIRHPVRKML